MHKLEWLASNAERRKMSQSTYIKLSQSEYVNEAENQQISCSDTSDECASSASQDSLDLVLLEIGAGKRPKRKVRRKRRRKMGGGIQSFEGAESYEVIELKLCLMLYLAQNRFLFCRRCHVTL